MAGGHFSDTAGATRASDFLNFEAPTYNQFGTDANSAGKSQGFSQFSATGMGSNGQANSAMPPSVGAPGGFGRSKEDNYLLKGIEFVKSSAANIQRGFGDSTRSNSVIGTDSILFGSDAASTARSSFSTIMNVGRSAMGFSSGQEGSASWLNYTNYKICVVLLVTSVIFFAMAFMTLPFIIFAPHKFGLLFTCASITFLASLAFLKGVAALLEHMLSTKRIAFTGALGVSMVSTLVFTTFYPIYILAIVSSLVQTLMLVSVILSYIPGGAGALKLMYSSIWEFIKNRGSGSTPLPL
ncbi:SFT2 family protein [Babesia ovis]|uniref:Vesicle transport protein n=1 Tax=Babesia ovis TaxID=5869 RepID=A0A9W5T8A6_BABOV|nr:SFT2 family protein [Babesia ovis]